MHRDQMTQEYIMQYQENCPDECEREMRKHLECLDHEEFMEEYEAYMN